MSDVTKEILEAFVNADQTPEAWGAPSDDYTSFGFEWHFKDGSVFWVDIDPSAGPPRFLWRKGRTGSPISGDMNAKSD